MALPVWISTDSLHIPRGSCSRQSSTSSDTCRRSSGRAGRSISTSTSSTAMTTTRPQQSMPLSSSQQSSSSSFVCGLSPAGSSSNASKWLCRRIFCALTRRSKWPMVSSLKARKHQTLGSQRSLNSPTYSSINSRRKNLRISSQKPKRSMQRLSTTKLNLYVTPTSS